MTFASRCAGSDAEGVSNCLDTDETGVSAVVAVTLAAVNFCRNAGFCTYCCNKLYSWSVPLFVCKEELSQP